MVRGPVATGETLGEMVRDRHKGMEGNMASAFPVHLGTGEPFRLLGLIFCPRSRPSGVQNANPAPTPPPRALPLHLENPSETPSNTLGLNPTHTPTLRAQPLSSRTPHSGGPPFHMVPLPFHAGPKQRPRPMLEGCPA